MVLLLVEEDLEEWVDLEASKAEVRLSMIWALALVVALEVVLIVLDLVLVWEWEWA